MLENGKAEKGKKSLFVCCSVDRATLVRRRRRRKGGKGKSEAEAVLFSRPSQLEAARGRLILGAGQGRLLAHLDVPRSLSFIAESIDSGNGAIRRGWEGGFPTSQKNTLTIKIS